MAELYCKLTILIQKRIYLKKKSTKKLFNQKKIFFAIFTYVMIYRFKL